ncbi:MAG TPA: imidazole glycerol phosphate synthase subunit HisF [Candidatus Baltobacteraceae bacterium]|jgi:cyclase|nr:imidazole glycerol phosphate synthase subunit HisF [Candidatus Baltobacteraceae bacterium]
MTGLVKRIIPCLDVKAGRVVKGVRFDDIADAGDPVALARRYEQRGADELVFLDITATIEGRSAILNIVRAVARELTIPFAVGGGVSSVENVRELLRAGCDKVSINSAAVRNPDILEQAAQEFGSQCVVVAMDARRADGFWEVLVDGGRTTTGLDCVAWAQEATRRGAGEILLTSMDRDGTKSGFDLELIRAVRKVTEVPVIASGGAGSVEDFAAVFTQTQVDAALAASLFHYGELDITSLKAALASYGIPVRPVAPNYQRTAGCGA